MRGRACGMMVMVPFLLGGTFFLDEATAKPARPLRSGFLFARGEHRRRPRVELTATRVGSTAMPRVLSRPSPEGPKLAPAQGRSYRAGAFLCRPPPRHLSWHEQISPDPRVTPTRQHHMLRHACGFKLANDGVDTRALQHFLGHRNIMHTVRYTELRSDRFDGFWKD